MFLQEKKGKVFISKLIAPEDVILEILEPIADIKLGHGKKYSEQELLTEIRDMDGIIVTMNEQVTKKVMEATSKLRIISKYGAGVENIDIDAATELGIIVAYSPLNDTAVAEHAILLMLASLRKLPSLKKHMEGGGWALDIGPTLLGGELAGKTVGIIGLGRIGSRLAKMLRCFGVSLLAYDPYVSGEMATMAELVDLNTLLRESDIVTLHVKLTPETQHLIGEKALKLMKPSAILVNTSRGAIVDEAALIKALEKGWIAGAGLDVFESEPPNRDNPLFKLDNVIITPHIAGVTKDARRKVVTQTAQSVAFVLEGKVPPNRFIVNREVLKRLR